MTNAARVLPSQDTERWWGLFRRVAYGAVAGIAGLLLALLVVTLWGPHFENGEVWEGLILGWWFFGGPATIIWIVLSSVLVFPLFRACRTWMAAGAVVVLNVIAITASALVLAAWAAGLL